MTPRSTATPPTLVWWIIWIAIFAGLVAVHLLLPPIKTASAPAALRYAPVLPLFASAILRWWVLPRCTVGRHAFACFVVGLALAEAGAILGIVGVPSLRYTYVLTGLLMVIQFAPRFPRRFVTADHPTR